MSLKLMTAVKCLIEREKKREKMKVKLLMQAAKLPWNLGV